MKQVLQNLKSGRLLIEEVPPPSCNPNGLLIKVRRSLISPGTERSKVEVAKAGYIGKAQKKPEQFKKVLEAVKKDGLLTTYNKVKDRLDRLSPLGYSISGEVIEVGVNVSGFCVGERVACAGAEYAFHAEYVSVPSNLCAKIPDNVTYEQASMTTLGAIAMQGFRQAEVMLGERVLVIGLGLLGQLTVGLIRSAGGLAYGIDIDPDACKNAMLSGASEVSARNDTGMIEKIMTFGNNHGVDSVIITAATSSNDPIELAGKVCRDKGKVIVVGAVRTDLPREDYYKKELDIRFSRSYGPGRYDPDFEEKGLTYPIGYVRWNENRNMREFLRLIETGAIRIDHLITHSFPIENAEQAYEIISGRESKGCIAITLKYSPDEITSRRLELSRSPENLRKDSKKKIGVGFIGGGNFARSMLIPPLMKVKGITLEGIACQTGSSSKSTGNKFGFNYCTTNPSDIIGDGKIDTVMIATRHDSHADLVIESLNAGKSVFVEKPLSINDDELERIVTVLEKTGGKLMVGFNRRFSEAARAVKNHIQNLARPFNVIYRINAGTLPPNHWVHDKEQGGNRIVGEVCHFVDLCQYFIDKNIISAKGFDSSTLGENSHYTENGSFILKFSDGSIATIVYSPFGCSAMHKERIEIIGGGAGAVIDDFRQIELYEGSKIRKFSFKKDLKGHSAEINEFFRSLRDDKPMPINIDNIINVSRYSLWLPSAGKSLKAQ